MTLRGESFTAQLWIHLSSLVTISLSLDTLRYRRTVFNCCNRSTIFTFLHIWSIKNTSLTLTSSYLHDPATWRVMTCLVFQSHRNYIRDFSHMDNMYSSASWNVAVTLWAVGVGPFVCAWDYPAPNPSANFPQISPYDWYTDVSHNLTAVFHDISIDQISLPLESVD